RVIACAARLSRSVRLSRSGDTEQIFPQRRLEVLFDGFGDWNDEPVVQLCPTRGELLPSPHTPQKEPGKEPPQREVADGLHCESRAQNEALESSQRVAPGMADLLVEGAVKPGAGWNEEQESSPRPKNGSNGAQHRSVVADVLEDVDHQSAVERRAVRRRHGERVGMKLFHQIAQNSHVWSALKSFLEHPLQVFCRFDEEQILHAIRVARGDVPHPGADLDHLAAKVGPKFFEDPLLVGRQSRERLEILPLVVVGMHGDASEYHSWGNHRARWRSISSFPASSPATRWGWQRSTFGFFCGASDTWASCMPRSSRLGSPRW